jgi:hypothetical protein
MRHEPHMVFGHVPFVREIIYSSIVSYSASGEQLIAGHAGNDIQCV